jgi:hypothetical protein
VRSIVDWIEKAIEKAQNLGHALNPTNWWGNFTDAVFGDDKKKPQDDLASIALPKLKAAAVSAGSSGGNTQITSVTVNAANSPEAVGKVVAKTVNKLNKQQVERTPGKVAAVPVAYPV